MHSTIQNGQWSFSQIYIITRREEFSISGEFLYTLLYINTRVSLLHIIIIIILALPNSAKSTFSRTYTFTHLHVECRYFTSHHTYSGENTHSLLHTTYVYIVILYKIRNTIIIKGHGDECIIEWLLCSNAPGFFLFYYYSTATGSNRVRTDVRRS